MSIRWKNRSGYTLAGLVLAAALAASACGSSGSGEGDASSGSAASAGNGQSGSAATSPSESSPKDVPTITFATGGGLPPNEMQAAIFDPTVIKAAGLTGYDKDYKLKILTTDGTSAAQSLLVADQAQVGTISFGTFASMISKKAIPSGLTIVAGDYLDGSPDHVSNAYVVMKDSGITSADDLRGKTLGVNVIGSAVDVALRVWLIDHGLDPKTDVNIVAIAFPSQEAALRSGRIDMGVFVQPFLSALEGGGGVTTLFTEADALGGENAAIDVAARTDFVKEHGDALKSFLADWVKGLKWLSDPDNREQAISLMAKISKVSEKSLAFYGTEKDYFRDPNGCVSAQALQRGIDGMVKSGFLDKAVDVASHVDLSYLPDPSKCKSE